MWKAFKAAGCLESRTLCAPKCAKSSQASFCRIIRLQVRPFTSERSSQWELSLCAGVKPGPWQFLEERLEGLGSRSPAYDESTHVLHTRLAHARFSCRINHRIRPNKCFANNDSWGNLLRSVPFLMAGHLNIKSFQTLGTPFFNTNPKNGCPKMICQHSGQAPRHLTCRFHYMSCSTDVRPWDSKRKFVFLLQIVPITKTLAPNASK